MASSHFFYSFFFRLVGPIVCSENLSNKKLIWSGLMRKEQSHVRMHLELVYLSVKLYVHAVCTFHPVREVTGNHLDLHMEQGNSYRDCHLA